MDKFNYGGPASGNDGGPPSRNTRKQTKARQEGSGVPSDDTRGEVKEEKVKRGKKSVLQRACEDADKKKENPEEESQPSASKGKKEITDDQPKQSIGKRDRTPDPQNSQAEEGILASKKRVSEVLPDQSTGTRPQDRAVQYEELCQSLIKSEKARAVKILHTTQNTKNSVEINDRNIAIGMSDIEGRLEIELNQEKVQEVQEELINIQQSLASAKEQLREQLRRSDKSGTRLKIEEAKQALDDQLKIPETLEELREFRGTLKQYTEIRIKHYQERLDAYKEYKTKQKAALNKLANIERDLMGDDFAFNEEYMPLSPSQGGESPKAESSLFDKSFNLDEEMREVGSTPPGFGFYSPGISDASRFQDSADPSRDLKVLQDIAEGIEISIKDHKLAIENRLREKPDQKVQQQLTDILQSLANAKKQPPEQEEDYKNYNQFLDELDDRIFKIRRRLDE